MSAASPRVLVVDDSAFMRSRIQRKVAVAGMDVVGEARDGNEAVEQYARLHPDLVTMDLTMRGADGLAAARSILASDPEAKIVLFSIVDDEEVLREAEKCGVKACVHKSRAEDLVKCLQKLTNESA